jgi:hypothetical protein
MISPEKMALKIRKKFASKDRDSRYGNLGLEFIIIFLDEQSKDKRPKAVCDEYWLNVTKNLWNRQQ